MKTAKILLLGCFLSLSSAAFATTAFWSGTQGNAAHTGYVAQTTNPANFHVLWQANLIGGTKNPDVFTISPPAVTDHAVYYAIEIIGGTLGTKHQLAAFNLTNGVEMWRQNLPSHSTQPAFIDNQIIVNTLSTNDHDQLLSFQAETGELLSTINSDNSPISTESVAFDHHIYLLGVFDVISKDATTGQTQWSNEYTGTFGLFDAPAVDDNYVYQLQSNQLHIMNRDTGKPVSSISVGDYTSWTNFPSAPVLDVKNKALYHVFRSSSGSITLQALDLAVGKVKWIVKYIDAQVVLADNDIYGIATDIKTKSRQLANIDALTGEVRWTWQPSDDALSIYFAPVVTDDIIFVSGEKNTYALSRKTHQVVWSIASTGELALGNGELLIRSSANVTAVALR